MGKAVGIGETIVDMIFRNGQPQKAVVGGSVFNAMVSMRRAGLEVAFVSETGEDKVGDIVVDFMKNNGMSTDFLYRYSDVNTAISLAFLNEKSDAEYVFYKPKHETVVEPTPEIEDGDCLIYGSYYSISRDTRPMLLRLLENSEDRDVVRYYDPNFRSSHLEELETLMPNIAENMSRSDIVRGSNEDFYNMFGIDVCKDEKGGEVRRLYDEKVGKLCQVMICTCGAKGVWLVTPHLMKHYRTPNINALSTIGAGDNFNAGVMTEIMRRNVSRVEIGELKEEWDMIIQKGVDFSTHVCLSYDNYIDTEYGMKI